MAEPESGVRRLAVVRFRAGGHDVAVEAAQVAAMRTTPVEGAPAIEDLLGLDAGAGGERRWLVMRGGSARCVEVGEPVRLDSFALDCLHPVPPLLAARQSLRGIAAIALAGQGAGLVVDLARLVEDSHG